MFVPLLVTPYNALSVNDVTLFQLIPFVLLLNNINCVGSSVVNPELVLLLNPLPTVIKPVNPVADTVATLYRLYCSTSSKSVTVVQIIASVLTNILFPTTTYVGLLYVLEFNDSKLLFKVTLSSMVLPYGIT